MKFRGKKIFSVLVLALLLVVPVFSGAASSENETFYVDRNYDRKDRNEVKSLLVKESDHAYFYLEKGYWSDLSSQEDVKISEAIEELAGEFDEEIYPELTSFWGSEWKPGVDEDSKITVLISQMEEGVGGYFNPQDEFSQDEKEESNEREMVYLSTRYLDHPRMKSFLAHEFQHLISFNQKERLRGFSDDVWLNDVRSEYSPTYLGYDENRGESNLEYRIDDFLSSPHNSLTEWLNRSSDYGVVNLFGQYVAEHYGKDVLRRTIFQNLRGIESFNQSLSKEGYEKDFEEIYKNWTLASYLNDPDFEDGLYSYTEPEYLSEVAVDLTASFILEGLDSKLDLEGDIKEWSPRWYEFEAGGEIEEGESFAVRFEIDFETGRGSPAAYLVRFDQQEPEKISDFSFDDNEATLTVRGFGQSVDKVLLVLFNKYDGEYPSGSLPEEAVGNFRVDLEAVEVSPEADKVRPRYMLNKDQEITIEGRDLEGIEKVKLGEKEIEEFLEKEDGRLVFEVEKFESPGKKELKFEYSGGSLRAGEIEVFESLPEGALVKTSISPKVYVIKDNYKRHLTDARIFSFYPHLGAEKVETVSVPRLSLYQESYLIREDGTEKVYELDRDGAKHWLDMGPAEFADSDRQWGAVYIINSLEANFYKQGEPIRDSKT